MPTRNDNFVPPLILGALSIFLAGCLDRFERNGAPIINVKASLATESVSADADDPALWIHPSEPERSLILGTNKISEVGGLYVFGLDGRVKQIVPGLDRPNNVDVEYGLDLHGRAVDIAVLTERMTQQLHVYAIEPDGSGVNEVSSGGGLSVFEDEPGLAAMPMGLSLYRRPDDGAIFAIVSRKTGPRSGYLWQYRLEDDGSGLVALHKVREFGTFNGFGEIEAVAVDDALGFVYYADEQDGIHKWYADPDHPGAGEELARFGTEGFRGDREGIAIFARADGSGYILCTDQLKNNSEYHVFRREGTAADPHDHSERVAIIRGRADDTDGIEATPTALGPRFPDGMLVAMNSDARNFLLYAFPRF